MYFSYFKQAGHDCLWCNSEVCFGIGRERRTPLLINRRLIRNVPSPEGSEKSGTEQRLAFWADVEIAARDSLRLEYGAFSLVFSVG
jgi:hypothetical protein